MNDTNSSKSDGSASQSDRTEAPVFEAGVSEEHKRAIHARLTKDHASVMRACRAFFGAGNGYATNRHWVVTLPDSDIQNISLDSAWFWLKESNNSSSNGDFHFVVLFTNRAWGSCNFNVNELDKAWLMLEAFLDSLDTKEQLEKEAEWTRHEAHANLGWKDKIFEAALSGRKERSFKNVPQLAKFLDAEKGRLKRLLDSWVASGDAHRFAVQFTPRGLKDRSIKLVASDYDAHLEYAQHEAQEAFNVKAQHQRERRKLGFPADSEEQLEQYYLDCVNSYYRVSVTLASKAVATDIRGDQRRRERKNAPPVKKEALPVLLEDEDELPRFFAGNLQGQLEAVYQNVVARQRES
jgi:hypothetical protein